MYMNDTQPKSQDPATIKVPPWITKNPLGIIAFFISLIYGMSALLLAQTVEILLPDNQTILVRFIVIFPFVVLAVFGWLLAKHHTKLYGPADYRNSDNGLTAHDK